MMKAKLSEKRWRAGPALVLLLTAAISGCAGLVPGSHLRTPDADPWFGPPPQDAEPLPPDLVRIQRIQPGVGTAAPADATVSRPWRCAGPPALPRRRP